MIIKDEEEGWFRRKDGKEEKDDKKEWERRLRKQDEK